jgi:hypothetical protein
METMWTPFKLNQLGLYFSDFFRMLFSVLLNVRRAQPGGKFFPVSPAKRALGNGHEQPDQQACHKEANQQGSY